MPDRLGRPSANIRFGRGLNTHDDPTRLDEGQLQTATRVRVDKGLLFKDRGTDQYGVNTDATSKGQGIGFHPYPGDPRLLIAADGDIKLDGDGAGGSWTDIVTGLDATQDVCFASQQGATFIANGRDILRRFAGGTAASAVRDFPRPEDTPLDYQPIPTRCLIDECDVVTATWIATGGGSVALDTSVFMFNTGSVRWTSTGADGDRIDHDLGAGATVDLSDSDFLSFWIKSNVAGTKFVLKISEDNSTWQTFWCTIPEDKVDVWVQQVWDIRAITPSSRDAIRYLRFGTPTSTACVVYLDHIIHSGPLAGEYTYAISFLDPATGIEGPLGCFRTIATQEPDDPTTACPRRSFLIPSNTIYMPPDITSTGKIRLRRTMAGGAGTFYKIADITPATNAWTYTDTTPDRLLTEDLALVLWPGQAPRAQWIIPHADRMLHFGGLVVASRGENYYSESDPLNRTTGVLNPSPYPALPVYGIEFYVALTGNGTLTFKLYRTTIGGSSWTEVASASANQNYSGSTWYRLAFTATSFGDLMFDPKRYDWKITCTARPTGLTLGNFWDSAAAYPPLYRLLCRADNLCFMSNFGAPDQMAPVTGDEEEVSGLAGGHFLIGDADAQKVAGALKHGSDVLVFKDTLIYLIAGSSMDDIDVIQVHPTLGLKVWRTAVDCDGIAVFMAQDRQIYAWKVGAGEKMLSKPLEDFFADLTDAQVAGACATWINRRYYLFLPNAGAGNYCRFYDFDEDAWSAGYDSAVYAATAYGDDPSVAQAFALNKGATYFKLTKFDLGEDDDGSNITWLMKGRAEQFENFGSSPRCQKRLRAYRIWHIGTGADTLTVKWYCNRSGTATRTYTDTIPSGTGVKAVSHFVHNDIIGRNLAIEIGGAHDTETGIESVDVWLDEVR